MEDQHNKKIQRIALELNKRGLNAIARQQQSIAFDFFKQAQKIIIAECKVNSNRKFQQLLAVTFNNLAIYYKKINKPKSALTYLKNALEIEAIKLKEWKAAASTHLNISAIYSFLQKHQQAIDHIKLAGEMIEKSEDQKARINVRSISLYNLGIQYENLKKYEESLQAYGKAKQLAKETTKQNIQLQSGDGETRVKAKIKLNNEKMRECLRKRKQLEQRGDYSSMRYNIKNSTKKGGKSLAQLKGSKKHFSHGKSGFISSRNNLKLKLEPLHQQKAKETNRYKEEEEI